MRLLPSELLRVPTCGNTMIFFLATSAHRYTMELYLRHWASSLGSTVEIVPYETLRVRRSFPAGAYIFSDLERLSSEQKDRAGEVCRILRAAGFPVLNDPTRTLTRYD